MAGLSYLLQVAQRSAQRIVYDDAKPHEQICDLDEHPYGLSVPSQENGRPRRIALVGYPGSPYQDPLIAHTVSELGKAFPGFLRGWYLRVIHAECWEPDRSRHDVVYEVGTPHKVLIAAGCTDCSGSGKVGKEQMDDVFTFLNQFYGIPITAVIVPYEQGGKVREHLLRRYGIHERQEQQ
ncbi:hypothetical protein C4552_02250 [Candidatus Parcubacteria bacterium]|nr:MAG: hypothetical protein C4552_02250 [Candidatus Parcubacteria bacterium]